MKLSLIASIVILFPFSISAGSIEKAEMLRQHGLVAEAKKDLIEIIHSNYTPQVIAEAYYLLGSIAFGENNISAALDTWNKLVDKYPDSQQALLVKDRIAQLKEFAGETTKVKIHNIIAQSYLRHADFWSERKRELLNIDTSWIPHVETAIKWYDKVIKEFPTTEASRLAYEGKMKTIIGWKDPGRDGDAYGIVENFSKYMPMLLATFIAFEADHPKASTLQAFRYQIAQAYWSHKDWEKTREWLKIIIDKAGSEDSFYKDLAEKRLQKVEH